MESESLNPSHHPFALLDRVNGWAKQTPARYAYRDSTGDGTTYAQLAAAVRSLRIRLGRDVPVSGSVLLRCANRSEFAVWFLALIGNGRRVCPVHLDLTKIEMDQLADRIGASAIIGAANECRSTLRRLPMEWATQFDRDRSDDISTIPGALLLASSGTTGQPKVVRRSTASLDAVADAMVRAIGFSPSDEVLAAVPLTHSYGLEHGLLAPLWAGSTVHLCDGFDLGAMSHALADTITVFPAVPAMIEMLTTLADAPAAMPKLRVAYSAGGPLSSALNDKFRQRFGRAVGQVYGMTEIGSVTFNDPNSPAFSAASVGRAMQGVSIRVVDTENSDGEITVRADSMFDGYLDGSAELIDGHFRTGDLGRLDANGNLFITGRSRLLIDTGGMKVNPIEIENLINTHPAVRESVVIALRQTDTIDRLRAVIVPRDDEHPPTVESIRKFLKERLAGFKVPRVIEFRAALPRSAAGKVLRKQVEAERCDE